MGHLIKNYAVVLVLIMDINLFPADGLFKNADNSYRLNCITGMGSHVITQHVSMKPPLLHVILISYIISPCEKTRAYADSVNLDHTAHSNSHIRSFIVVLLNH